MSTGSPLFHPQPDFRPTFRLSGWTAPHCAIAQGTQRSGRPIISEERGQGQGEIRFFPTR